MKNMQDSALSKTIEYFCVPQRYENIRYSALGVHLPLLIVCASKIVQSSIDGSESNAYFSIKQSKLIKKF